MAIDREKIEQKLLERTGYFVTGKYLSVQFLHDKQDLGFTNGAQKKVYIAWEHEIYDGMSEDEKSFMRKGVFAHEILHQLLTNFSYTDKICRNMSSVEREIFMAFANTLEDPAIEYFAPECLGVDLVDALHYSIKEIYKKSPEINNSNSPFSQLINAMVQFGDMGVIKGEFTFPEAKEIFVKIAPLYNKGIVEPRNRKRLDIAMECMEIARPLWEEEAKKQKAFEKMLQELLKELFNSPISKQQDAGITKREVRGGDKCNDARSEKRTENADKLEGQNAGSSSDGQQDGQNAGQAGDREEVFGNGKSSGSNENSGQGKGSESNGDSTNGQNSDKAGNGNGSQNRQDFDKTGNSSKKPASSGKSKEDGENNAESNSPQQKGSSSMSAGSGKGQNSEQASGNTANVDEALKLMQESKTQANSSAENLTGDTSASLNETKKAIEQEIQKENKESNQKNDFSVINAAEKKVRSHNQVVRPNESSVQAYNKLVNACQADINYLSKTIKGLFEQDVIEEMPFTSGKYNVLRGEKQTSAKIFDKKKIPAGISDLEVILCIDTSGSMSGSNIANAQIAATMLVEACAKVNVPCYVMGFSCGSHTHYVPWKHSRRQASAIAQMSASGGTDDATAVRFATELLKKNPSEHRIMFVISDGYGNGGLNEAVKEARRIANVFAIGIGDIDKDYFTSVYKTDFIRIENPKGLSKQISSKLIKLIKRSSTK